MTKWHLLFISIFCICLISCNQSIPIYISANKSLNLNDKQAALPVEIKLFLLKQDKRFVHASFYNLWHDDLHVLSDSVISKKIVIISPKSKRVVHLNGDENVKYLGVVAIFRNINHAHWRVIKKINQAEKLGLKNITIQLIKNKVTII